VGEGPGFEEDQQGRPFVGAAGQLLTDIIVKGMKLKREDVYICNIVKCRPPDNRNPEPDEVEACIGFVKRQIAAINPKVIVTLGNVPTQNLLMTKQGITKLRGVWQEYQGIPVMPTFHPSYLLRSPGEKKKVWEDSRGPGKAGMPVSEKKNESQERDMPRMKDFLLTSGLDQIRVNRSSWLNKVFSSSWLLDVNHMTDLPLNEAVPRHQAAAPGRDTPVPHG
jgi:uracil-DNA glycosylase family 4